MNLRVGDAVKHSDYGIGQVTEVFGDQCVVNFFGELLTVLSADVERVRESNTDIEVRPCASGRITFRRVYEAMNLGVVPPQPDELLKLSIGGEHLRETITQWLEAAPKKGLCKVIFGDYGSGKSHHLRTAEALALKAGWAVSFVEFDPKQADPAKPHLVYRAIIAALRFPQRVDGSHSTSFYDLVGEVRRRWDLTSTGQMFKESPWFSEAMAVLRLHSHAEEQHYLEGVNWLGGQVNQHSAISFLARNAGRRQAVPPRMPRTLETAEIYVQHLAVINEWCKALGYRGLLILLDEAEHVRGFSVNRQDRATNLFDLLARSAHLPNAELSPPHRNDHDIRIPGFWKRGPHFGLVVGLTEGETFTGSATELRDACVFLHAKRDMVRLLPPSPADYGEWCAGFLDDFVTSYPEKASLLTDPAVRRGVAANLTKEYAKQQEEERTLRVWVKAASLVPSIVLSGTVASVPELDAIVRTAARQAAGEILPWEN